jgi:uncharacterized coiled-coil protein SlyX
MVIMRCFIAYVVLFLSVSGGAGWCASDESRPVGSVVTESSQDVRGDAITSLKRQVAVQQQQIAELQNKVAEILAKLSGKNELASAAGTALIVGAAPSPVSVPPRPEKLSASTSVPLPGPNVLASPQGQGQYLAMKDEGNLLSKVASAAEKNPLGIKLSGDLVLRSDMESRSGNAVAASLQNARERYKLRLNFNKALGDQFDFHAQLGSGTFNNPLSEYTDFTGTTSREPIFLNEFSAGYHPNQFLEIRGGRLEEVFTDDSRFEFDDEVRFNGMQEVAKVPTSANFAGITRFEVRAGQYIFTNPNISVLPSAAACMGSAALTGNCLYLAAGYKPGGRVGDADLFHQGFGIYGNLTEGWAHHFFSDFQWYRNANQLALASTTLGFPLVENGFYGVSLTGPISGIGTATDQAGYKFWAQGFQIVRLDYQLGHEGWKTRRENLPVMFDMQGSRNVGTSFARDAFLVRVSVGEVKKAGQVRLLYSFAYKDANSMLSQVTDSKMGTLTGVNIRTHHVRFDLGLTSFLQWQTLLYLQDEIRKDDPARNFYVPLQAGAATQYRVQSQFLFQF